MKGWTSGKIKDFGRVVTGKTPPTAEAEYFNGSDLFVSPKDLDFDSRYINHTETAITEKALAKFKNQVIPRDTVMFTSLSYSFGKVGIASRRCLTNQQINSIIVKSEHDFRFVFYLLRVYKPIIFTFNSGIDTPLVPKSVFEKVQVLYPNQKTQQKIAAILSAYDDLIENNKRRIAILEKMAEEIYREWFVRMRFPGADGKRNKEQIPEKWRFLQIGDLIKRIAVGKRYEQKTALPMGKTPILDQGQSGVIGYHDDTPGVIASFNQPVIVFAKGL